jgi:hypothetical protein
VTGAPVPGADDRRDGRSWRRDAVRVADRLLHPPAVRGWLWRKLQTVPDVAELV